MLLANSCVMVLCRSLNPLGHPACKSWPARDRDVRRRKLCHPRIAYVSAGIQACCSPTVVVTAKGSLQRGGVAGRKGWFVGGAIL